MMKRKLIVVDVETTGLDPSKDSILQLAAVVYQDGGISGEFVSYVNEPDVVINAEAQAVNGIGAETIMSAPAPWHVVASFQNWLGAHELYGQQMLAGHKVAFDVEFMKRLWRLAGVDFEKQFGHRHLCTQSLAIALDYAGRLNLPGGSASLDNVAAVFNMRRDLTDRHDALEDARLTARVLGKIIEKIK